MVPHHADLVPLLHDPGGAVHGHPRRGGALPVRGWRTAASGLAGGGDRRPRPAALLWQPVGIAAGWLFWTLPRRAGDSLGWIGVTVGALLALALLVFLLSPRMRRYRPWLAMVVAGLIIGIVVAFIPIVLGLPISPEYFERIMWFPSWI